MTEEPIPWHPGFRQALELDFEEYRDVLDFTGEVPLTAEPMRIDMLVIKKVPSAVIDNPIAGIFRGHNIFEYKSPTDYLSVTDFYKGLTYTFAYRSLTEADMRDITLSFAVPHYPRTVLEEIRRFPGHRVSVGPPGITRITAFGLAMQVIEPKKLSPENNRFLRQYRNDLERQSLEDMLREAQKRHKVGIDAYIDALSRANSDILEEILMSNKTLEQVLENVGLAAKWEARGEARAKAEVRREVAQKLISEGFEPPRIANLTGLDVKAVNDLLAEAGPHG